jgi:hypothetical protein
MIRQIRALYGWLVRATVWPSTVAHEMTHLIVSLPWAVETALLIDDAGPRHVVRYGEETPRWAVWLTSLAPALLGTIVAIGGAWLLLTAPPESGTGWLLAAALAWAWVVFMSPSTSDLDISTDTMSDTNTTDGGAET